MTDSGPVSHVLVVGSAPVSPQWLKTIAADATAIVCADGGADATLRAGLLPAVVVGDMDSLPSGVRAELKARGVPLLEHPAEKDQTDLELALDQALAQAPGRITIAGALGGARLDHALGNVLLLTLPSLREIDVRLIDETAELFVVWAERCIRGTSGEYLSLLPLTPRVDGVRTVGLRYPLHDEALVQGFTRGVSNELAEEAATVAVRSGCLLVVHERIIAMQ